MTDQNNESTPAEPTNQPTDQPIQDSSGQDAPFADGQGSYAPQPYDQGGYAPQAYGQSSYPQAMGPGSVGKVRRTGVCILLLFVTFGIYSLFWYFKTHEEMKRHGGLGMGGGLALLLAFFVGFVMPYLTSSEVGDLYERSGRSKPVSGITGLWYFPGMLIVIGPIVWFVKTNGALNNYWRSMGAH